METSSTAHSNSRQVLVWLVHGTYGRGFSPGRRWPFRPSRGPIWSESGSPFREGLGRELAKRGIEAHMAALHWSGANSVRERDTSAHGLANILDEKSHLGLPQLVIGHSHGGTIALTAAEHYRKESGEVLVVTLATPFIDMFPRIDKKDPNYNLAVIRYHNLQLGKAHILGFLASCLSCFAIHAVFPGVWPYSFNVGYIVMAALVAIYAITFNTIYGKYADSLNDVPPPHGSARNGLAVRLLVVRGTEDEAALALAAGSIQSLLASGVGRWAVILLAIIGTFWTTILYYLGHRPSSQAAVTVFFCATIASLAFFMFVSLLEAVGRAVFGREFFFTGQIYSVNVNSTPDFAGDITIRTLPGQTGRKVTPLGKEAFSIKNYTYRRRHSLYEHSNCVELIADWVNVGVNYLKAYEQDQPLLSSNLEQH